MMPRALALALLLAAGPALAQQTSKPKTPTDESSPLTPLSDIQIAEPEKGESPVIFSMRMMINGAAEEDGATQKELRFGSAPANAPVKVNFAVDPTKGVLIAAACDYDCSSLYLAAYDDMGKLLGETKGDTDVPQLKTPAIASGKLTVEVKIGACKRPACRVGIGVHTRKT